MNDGGVEAFLLDKQNLELARAYGSMLVTLLAAIAAGFISWRLGKGQLRIARAQATTAIEQRDIARDKLRLDLFEERFECYKAVEAFSTKYASRGLKQFDDEMLRGLWEFDKHLSKAYFLFPSDIHGYLNELRDRATKIPQLAAVRDSGDPQSRQLAITQGYDLLRELLSETTRAREIFSLYLSFGHIRS